MGPHVARASGAVGVLGVISEALEELRRGGIRCSQVIAAESGGYVLLVAGNGSEAVVVIAFLAQDCSSPGSEQDEELGMHHADSC